MKPLIALRFNWRSGIIHSTINMGCHCTIDGFYLLILIRSVYCVCLRVFLPTGLDSANNLSGRMDLSG